MLRAYHPTLHNPPPLPYLHLHVSSTLLPPGCPGRHPHLLSLIPMLLALPRGWRASPRAQLVENPPAMQETPVRFLAREDLLEKG